MRLEKLEIQGFKSFRDKTVLEFPDHFTAIVGPNGSGKSNIVDSICFVLGRSRGLRVNNLRELICNGGVGGKESEYAKVSIYLREGDKKRIKISREIDREGHSTYKIDNKRASRQEIIDLIGDNEYNIILQDDITRVIEMQPRERRQIIDDLCGIREYDKKKAKAIKELERVENRISETHIILGEKKGYLEQLRKERDDAVRYQKLQDELRRCNATILHKNIVSHEKRLKNINLRLEELERKKRGLTEYIENTKRDISEKNEELREINSKILKLEKEKGLAKIPEIKGELVRSHDRIESLNKNLEDIKRRIHERRERRNGLISEINSLESRLKAVNEKLEFLNSRIQEEFRRFKGMGVEEKIDESKTEIFDLRSKINVLLDSNRANEKRIEELMGEKTQIEDRIHELVEREKELGKKITEMNKKYRSELEEFERLKSKIPEINEQQIKIQKLLEGLRVEFAEKKTELETVEKSGGGLRGAVRTIMNLKEIIPGVYGPIFRLGTVLNPDYEEAMKVAAGGRMYNIVVENEDTAIKCINYLRKKRIGRATFLPLNRIKFRRMHRPPRGSIGFARDFITTNAKYKPAFDYIFGNTILVRDLKTAREIGVGKWRMVTLEGDLLTESGAMTGGYIKRVEIGFGRVDELEKELKILDRRIIELDGEKQELQLRKEKMEKKLSKLEISVASGRTDIERMRLEKSSLADKKNELKERIDEIMDDIRNTKKLIAGNEKKIRLIGREIKSREKNLELLMRKRSEIRVDQLEKLKDNYRDLEIEQKTLEERMGLLRQRINEIEEELRDLGKQKEHNERELNEVRSLHSEMKRDLAAMERENSRLMQRIETMLNERSELEKKITELGSKVGEKEYELDNINEEINKTLIKNAEIETKLSSLREEFTNFQGVEIQEISFKELESRIREIEMELEEIGSVNLRAIESYELINKEFEKTKERLETLKNERQSIFDFMERVEKRKRETFMTTFNVVKNNFEQIYKELTGGRGTLILDNPRAISESGLLINASPKGKKLINMDTMSSGEKVLTSSAFLLAIQRYKPSHFYIVDEMDASLDRENSLRLAEILRNSTAQFILISHNDEVIKKAESVIGVSISNGISQVVGVKLT